MVVYPKEKTQKLLLNKEKPHQVVRLQLVEIPALAISPEQVFGL